MQEHLLCYIPLHCKLMNICSYYVHLSYYCIIAGMLFYLIGRELFSGQSPSGLYGKALKLCRKHPEVCNPSYFVGGCTHYMAQKHYYIRTARNL